MIPLFAAVREVAVLGAHCDDIAIGMGGTLSELCSTIPGLRVRALVLTGAGTSREDEERAALAALLPGADLEITVLDFRDGRLPASWDRVKDSVAAFARAGDPDLVFAPHRNDAHQDHRLLAEVTPTEFRDHLILGYEILKWETETPSPSVFLPFSPETAQRKQQVLLAHYPSQRHHDWFGDGESFVALSRLRGVQCRAPHAEAFVLEKATISFTKESTCVS